jgi:hypothetical protein
MISLRLEEALENGTMTVIRNLINRNNINAFTFNGSLPIGIAAVEGNIDLVKFLYYRGANVNKRDTRNFTPLMGAVINNNFEIVKFLVEHGANIDVSGGHLNLNIFGYADMYHHGNGDILNFLLDYYAARKIQQKARGIKGRKKAEKTRTIKKAKAVDLIYNIQNDKGLGILPKDMAKEVASYLYFGKKRKVSEKTPKSIKDKAKKLKIRLTVTKNGRFIPKSRVVLEKQIKNKLKFLKK